MRACYCSAREMGRPLSFGVTMLNQNGKLSSMPTKSANASRLPSIFSSPDVTACSGVSLAELDAVERRLGQRELGVGVRRPPS